MSTPTNLGPAQNAALPPTPDHHANLQMFLQILDRFSVVALTLGPAVAAPFVRSAAGQANLSRDAAAAGALAGFLSSLPAAPTDPADIAHDQIDHFKQAG